MKKAFHIFKEVISWVLLIAVFCLLAFTIYANVTDDKQSGGAFVFGYRPVVVMSGSMEPYMQTYSVALTKAVSDIDELAVGDVVSFNFVDSEGRQRLFTHRIISIDGEHVFTKGDRNPMEDGIALTMENIDAKVIYVCNAPGLLIEKWQSSTAAKVMIVSLAVCAVLLVLLIRTAIHSLGEKLSLRNADTNEPHVFSESSDSPPAAHESSDNLSSQEVPVLTNEKQESVSENI